jgi:hypothetical protein
MARQLGVTGLQLPSSLRSQQAAGHPLLDGHQYRQRWKFTRAEANRLMAEFGQWSEGSGRSAEALKKTLT